MTINDLQKRVWGIHAGRTGDANELFLKRNTIALGWEEIEDLSKLPPSRDAFKQKVKEVYPDYKPGSIPVQAGQLFRFIHEMKMGDLVAYPSKVDKGIHIGQVTSDYRYDVNAMSYRHQRSVKWLRSLPRTYFKQGTLYGIGSAMTIFSLDDYADEFVAASKGETKATVSSEKDETVVEVAENIQQTTRDFILKKLSQDLKGHPFTHFVAHLLEVMGYRTRVSEEGADGGIDIIAHKDELGFEPPIIKVQVKSIDKDIGEPDVRDLSGVVQGNNEYGLFVTLGRFGTKAKIFARGRSNLRLIDGEELVTLIFQHYEHFDSRYKALLPLKRVYVPEVLSEQ